MKIGILGGTFNPPHLGHLRLAEEVSEGFGLDRIIFVPCHQPPHKDEINIATSIDRFNMTSLACAGNTKFEVSDMELKFPAPSYTVNTLRHLKSKTTDELYFIMGSDSLSEIGTWKDFENLFSLANYVIVERPGLKFQKAWESVPAELRQQFTRIRRHFIHSSKMLLIPSRITGLNVSSTHIRKLLSQGLSVRYLSPESVLDYIRKKNLYSGQESNR
ncbi:MAG: nicotinate-nucleotide adenylyltransferase [Pseudomonadota bacterium]